MRLLLVTHFYSTHRGGVEIAAQRLGEALCRAHDVSIEWIASDCDPAPAALPEGLRCTPARSWNGIERACGVPYPLWGVGALRALWRAMGECDAVHAHETAYMGNLVAFLFARLRGKPFFVTQHVGWIPFRSRVLRALLHVMNRTLVRVALSGAERVFFVSPAVQQYFEHFVRFRSPPQSVANGVDATLYRFSESRDAGARPLCLFVGRFVEKKGVRTVLALARRLPQVDWILAGDGVLRPEEGAPPNVSVVRGRSGPDIAALYSQADLLVLPSVGEGFPLVVQEAMACGTPALVGPGTAEGAPAARPWLIVEPLDEERWVARIESVLADPGLKEMRADVARAARALWSWDGAALAYASAFRDAGFI